MPQKKTKDEQMEKKGSGKKATKTSVAKDAKKKPANATKAKQAKAKGKTDKKGKEQVKIAETIAETQSAEEQETFNFEGIDLENVTAYTEMPKRKRGRPSKAEMEARKALEKAIAEARIKEGLDDTESEIASEKPKKVKGPGAKATTFKRRELTEEEAEKMRKAQEAAENKPRSQTKEEQAKKKADFNASRVQWFDEYMSGKLATLSQLSISPNREIVLSGPEQIKMAELIQSSIAATILKAAVEELQAEEGDEEPHLRKTISGDKEQVLELLREKGYTPERFIGSRREMRKLNHLVEEGNEARNLFAEKNLRLVKLIAGRRKKNTPTASSVDFDDLVAEGMGGLMVAIDHFNPAMGNLFSTPAAGWIDQPIRNYLDSKTKTIHMPTHMNNIYKSIHYATRALRDIYNDDSQITDERISEYCQSKGRDITVEKIQEARMLRRETISYDAPVGENGSNNKTLAEMIESEEDHAADILYQLSSQDTFNRVLALVEDDKKREILRDWYSTEEARDIVILSNVSRKHCLTKERVRQLKNEAEEELRSKISTIAKEKGIDAEDVFLGNY